MKKILLILSLFASSVLLNNSVFAMRSEKQKTEKKGSGKRPSKEVLKKTTMVKLVLKAKKYFAKKGEDKAFSEFNKEDGLFNKKGHYIFVYGMDGVCKAIGSKDHKDRIGKKCEEDFIKEMIKIAKSEKGHGYLTYKWDNATKTSFVDVIKDKDGKAKYVIGTGVLKTADTGKKSKK